MSKNIFQIRVGEKEVGKRLDLFLTQKFTYLSRSKIQKIIEQKLLTVNGKNPQPAYLVKEKDEIKFFIPQEEPKRFDPESIPLKIIYEDQDILVVDKPAGMVVHPACGRKHGTLLNAVLGYLGDFQLARAGIVHRLDKETSGLIVIAKNEQTQSFLQLQFKMRSTVKKYLSLVWGRMGSQKGIVDAPIGRSRMNRKKMTVTEKGKAAQNYYKVVKVLQTSEDQFVSLLEVTPKTGRTHQIRVHLKALGHPVVGDKTYGRNQSLDRKLGRQFLHAYYLKFRLPDEGEKEISIQLSRDLERFFQTLTVKAQSG